MALSTLAEKTLVPQVLEKTLGYLHSSFRSTLLRLVTRTWSSDSGMRINGDEGCSPSSSVLFNFLGLSIDTTPRENRLMEDPPLVCLVWWVDNFSSRPNSPFQR